LLIKNRDDDIILGETDTYGETLLIKAAKAGNAHIVNCLIENGADVLQCNTTVYQDSALSWSVFNGHTDCSRLLIYGGSDLQHQTVVDGNSLLMWAYRQKRINDFYLLLYSGASLHLVNKFGKDVVSMCCATDDYGYIIKQHKHNLFIYIKKFLDYYHVSYEESLIPVILEYL
jgi:ankyrin repeat protein